MINTLKFCLYWLSSLTIVNKFRIYRYYLFSAFSKPIRQTAEQREKQAQVQSAIQATISDRKEEKVKICKRWSDPKTTERRKRLLEAKAKASYKKIRIEFGLPLEDAPLPPMDQLPPEMRGQQPSTIRKMLKHKEEEPLWMKSFLKTSL